VKIILFAALLLLPCIESRAQPALSEDDKKVWRYKALGLFEISPPYLQKNAQGQKFLCVTMINHLPFDVKEVWFHFEGQDETIAPREGYRDWQMQNIAAGETRVVWIRPRRHIRGDPGISVIKSMIVPGIDLCAYWPVKKKEADPWKCK